MLRWDEALYTEKLVKKDLLERAWTPYLLAGGQKADYGYGWWVSQPQGVRIIMHPGAIGGFRSFSFRIPSQHLFVVFLSNNARVGYTDPMESLSSRLAGLTWETPPVHPLSPEQMNEYAGVYEMLHLRLTCTSDVTHQKLYRTITVRDTVLIFQAAGGEKVPLWNIGKDLFVVADQTRYFQFRRDDGGKITALEWHYEPISFGPVRSEPKTDQPLPRERVPISLDENALRGVAGKYNLGGGHTSRVRVEGSRVFMDGVGEIFPESETHFFAKDADVKVEFLKDAKGVVTGLVLNEAGKYEASKIE
jgi:hypothetical protein